MALAVSLYSRPKIVPECIRLLMEKIEGRISQAELEDRMEALEDRQQDLFRPQIAQISQMRRSNAGR